MSNNTGISGLDMLPSAEALMAAVDETVLDTLRKIGYWALEKAPELHEFDNYSYNLQDSYAFAIYKDGLIIGAPQLNPKLADEPNPTEFGHDESYEYLKSLNPDGTYSLVVCAKTDYAEEVENVNQGDVMLTLEDETFDLADKEFSALRWRILK